MRTVIRFWKTTSKLILLLGVSCAACLAQSTTVSGTISDANGQAFAIGTYSVSFYAAGTVGPWHWTGGAFSPSQTFSGSLGNAGSFSGVSIPSNNAITPAGTAWMFTFCPASTSPCYTQPIVVTGTTLNLSSLITPPAIQVNIATGSQIRAYQNAEIQGATWGSQYFNLTDNTLHFCAEPFPPCTWISVGALPPLPLPIIDGGTGTASPALTAGTGIAITGTWPFNAIANTSLYAPLSIPLPIVDGGTETASPALSAGTGIGVSGSWPNNTVSLLTPVSIGDGGTGTASPALTAGAGISISGAWPDNTIASTSAPCSTPTIGDLAIWQTGPCLGSTTSTGSNLSFTDKLLGGNVAISASTTTVIDDVILSALPPACGTNGCRIRVSYSYYASGGTQGLCYASIASTNFGQSGLMPNGTYTFCSHGAVLSPVQFSSGATPQVNVEAFDIGNITVCQYFGPTFSGSACGSGAGLQGDLQVEVVESN